MTSQQTNTLVSSGDIEEHVLLVGGEDPALIKRIVSGLLQSHQLVSLSRGFITYRCKSAKATPLTLSVTGVGPAATEIAVTEYSNCGARVIIRAGTSGVFSETVELGSVVISTKALRFDGVSDLYLSRRFHATAHHQVVRALKRSAETLAIGHSLGLTLSTSSFYAMGGTSEYGTIAFSGRTPMANFEPLGLARLRELIPKHEPLNIEMETTTLLILSRVYGLKAGSVCGISNRVPWQERDQIRFAEQALRNAILVGFGAIDNLYPKT